MRDMAYWEPLFKTKIEQTDLGNDPAHDLAHFLRVVATAKKLCAHEKGREQIVIPAAWLHDLVNVRKDDPRRSQASRLSAIAAVEYLKSIEYPEEYFDDIAHAIETHSFSANITPRTLEAKIVQDADRLDALGAIGMARCFTVGGALNRTIYNPEDPVGRKRAPDEINDRKFTVDHFFAKLFLVGKTLKTPSAQKEAESRVQTMRLFLDQLERETLGL